MKQILASIVISVMTTWIVVSFFMPSLPSTSVSKAESVYDRVMRTKILRCGYFVWPPHFTVDMKTGQKGGVYHDIVEELGRTLGLKIEWTQEYNLGTQVEALKSGKVDVLCADGPWTRSALPYLDYSVPYYYVPGYLYARKGNPRIQSTTDLSFLNSPAYSITSIDGDGAEEFTRVLFPQIGRVSLPGTSDPNFLVQNILTGKADVMWNDPMTIEALPKDQKEALVTLNPGHPVGSFPFVISVQKGQESFLRMLDQGIDVMRDMGVLKKIVQTYHFPPGALYLPQEAYVFEGLGHRP